MKKLLFILLFFTEAAMAQVTMQPGLPAMGLVQKSQLWNVLLVNNGPLPYNVKLDIVLTDRSTGLETMTATSGIFELKPGAKQLNMNLAAPVQYNYLGIAVDSRIQNLLPPGTYTACYLLVATGLKEVTLGEECVSFDVEPLSPPMLIFPSDSSILKETPSQFSWIPPTPAGMFNNLRYEVIITAINEGQKAAEAIEENLPFFNDGNQLMTNLVYPAASNKLEKNQWYAWQVIAKDDKSYAGKSEVWVFKMDSELKDPGNINTSYAALKSVAEMAGVYYFSGNKLNVKYYSFEPAHSGLIRLTSLNGTPIKEVRLNVVYGDNLFSIDLDKNFHKGDLYSAELIALNGQKYSTMFSINK